VDHLFLDANVLFSAVYSDQSKLLRLWELPAVRLLTSFYDVTEVLRNLDTDAQIERLNQLLRSTTVVASSSEDHVRELPDGIDLPEKDRPILNAALRAGATHLLTGDKRHFGEYFGNSVGGILILRPRDYLGADPA